jgi:hypothetical protein
MFLVLAVILVGVVAAGALAIALSAGGGTDRRRAPTLLGLPKAATAAVGLVAIILLAPLVAVAVLGVPGPRPGGRAPPPPGARTSPAPAVQTPIKPAASNLRVVELRAADEDRFAVVAVVDRLPPDGVVRVRAVGFGSFERGDVAQCVTQLERRTSCTGWFPVQFDEDGRADVQYRLDSSFAPGGCRRGQPTCALRVTGRDSDRQATVQTVFIDDAGRGRVTVTPSTGLADGQVAIVSVDDFPAGSAAAVTLCAPPGRYDVERCGSPRVGSTIRVGADGSGRTTFAVRAVPVGGDRVRCGPRQACAVTVVTHDGYVAAPSLCDRNAGDTLRQRSSLLARFARFGSVKLGTGLTVGRSCPSSS